MAWLKATYGLQVYVLRTAPVQVSDPAPSLSHARSHVSRIRLQKYLGKKDLVRYIGKLQMHDGLSGAPARAPTPPSLLAAQPRLSGLSPVVTDKQMASRMMITTIQSYLQAVGGAARYFQSCC